MSGEFADRIYELSREADMREVSPEDLYRFLEGGNVKISRAVYDGNAYFILRVEVRDFNERWNRYILKGGWWHD